MRVGARRFQLGGAMWSIEWLRRAAPFLCCSVLALAVSLAGELVSSVSAAELSIELQRADQPGARDRFELIGLSDRAAEKLRELGSAEIGARFAVFVQANELADNPAALFGDHRIDGLRIVFEPRFALQAGLAYRAVYRPADGQRPVERTFRIPAPARQPAARVAVFPTREKLPENLLKFYLQFTDPMSRGEAYRRIHLFREMGSGSEVKIADPFLELYEELWDPSGTRFTLFFDPGRVKRGLRPREEIGPALEEGGRYRLVIDRQWPDAEGQPMKEGCVKRFQVVAPDYVQPDPERWRIIPPTAGTRDPLQVISDESLDRAMLERVLAVADRSDQFLRGTIEVDQLETRWQFRPQQAWEAGEYALAFNTNLEDLAGNSIARPFEVDVFREVEARVRAVLRRVPFHIR